jgi:tetratricopeptide (TPR) repeat protein
MSWAIFVALVTVASSCTVQAERGSPALSELNQYCTERLRLGDLAGAEAACGRALEAARERLPDSMMHVQAQRNFGLLRWRQGRLDEARSVLGPACDRARSLLGRDHPMIADDAARLALLHQYSGRYDEARTLLLEALALRRSKHGDNSVEVAGTLARLGLLFQEQGLNAKARPLLQQALSIWEAQPAPNAMALSLLRMQLARLRCRENFPDLPQACEMRT